MAEISLIVAAAENNVIGRDGGLPWHLRADLVRFKALTMGKPVVMGRRTFESIGKPLPGRRNIVVTSRADYRAPGCEVVGSIDAALAAAADAAEIMVIGGGDIYRQLLPRADRIYFTRVHVECDGDAYFPELDPDEWRASEESAHAADAANDHAFSALTLDRKQ
jgi:dihydrofolate reductase